MPDFEFDNLAAGLNYRDTNAAMGKSQNVFWIDSSNVKPYLNTGIQKTRGNTLVVNHGTKIITAGNHKIGNSEYIMFVDSAGNMYEYDTAGSSKSAALVAGLDTSARGAWVTYGQGVIYSNGVDEPVSYFRGRSTSVTGTATINGTTTVEGSGTSFTTELLAGDSITINSETKIIDSITDDDTLVVRSAFSGSDSGLAITRNKITWLIAEGADGETLRSTAIAVYKGRVYMGYNGGLYWTAQGTYQDWTTADDAGYNLNFFNDSSIIQALSVFDDFLAIHRKEQCVLMLDAEGTPDHFIFDIKANRGSQSQFGNLTVQNDHIFYDAGIWPLGETGVLDQIILKSEISAIINNDDTGFLKGELDTSRVDEITILHYRDQKEIWFYFPITNVTYFQYVYVFDYQQNVWYKRISPQEITCAIEHKNYIYSFDSGGKIYREDIGSDWNGTDLSFYIQLAYINFGETLKQKDIDEIQILTDTDAENDFDYKYFFDYDSYNSTAVQNFSITGDPNALIWANEEGTNTDTVWANEAGDSGNDWAQAVLESGYLDSYNGIKSISLHFSGSGSSQGLGIVGLNFNGVVINSK